jgi:glycosyltransferase involved in cell wall biosynthesis
MLKRVSIIIPCFNEQDVLEDFFAVLKKTTIQLSDVEFDYIFVNDGSTDNTLLILKNLSKKNENTHYISLSKNFGKEVALSAGLSRVKSDAAIMIDADGQHPPELIPELINEWKKGSKVVIGRRTENQGANIFRKYMTDIFAHILKLIGGGDESQKGLTDYRLIDKQVVEAFNLLGEHNRITRGLIDWLGFKRSYIDFIAQKRIKGKASYSIRSLIRLALHAFVSHSTRPLKLIGLLGLIISSLAVVLEIVILFFGPIMNDPYNWNITGTFHIGILITFMCGILLTAQGLMALYIDNIYTETRNRPLFIVEESSI